MKNIRKGIVSDLDNATSKSRVFIFAAIFRSVVKSDHKVAAETVDH